MSGVRLPRVVSFSVLVLSVLVSADTLMGQQKKERIEARDFFGSNAPATKYIETDTTQVLVFDGTKGGDFIIGPGDVDIDAAEVEVRGDVVVRSYAATEKQPDNAKVGGAGANQGKAGQCGRNGCRGADGGRGGDGPEGQKGLGAGKIKLKLRRITFVGAATLTFIANGGEGGRGGVGGRGGDGGAGGDGAGRACGDFWGRHADSPGDGGDGGHGANGGNGGPGGAGGDGGLIDYSRELEPHVKASRVKLAAAGGEGGNGGPGGNGGAGGSPGGAGSGAACGGGGTAGRNAGADRRGEQSPSPGRSAKGQDGIVRCYNCDAPQDGKRQWLSFSKAPK